MLPNSYGIDIGTQINLVISFEIVEIVTQLINKDIILYLSMKLSRITTSPGLMSSCKEPVAVVAII